MTQNTIVLALWIGIAVWGIWVMSRAIGRSATLVQGAKELETKRVVIDHLKNVLFMYRTRLWLIVNNLLLGLLIALSTSGLVRVPIWVQSLYTAVSLLINELTLILLTYKDERSMREGIR